MGHSNKQVQAARDKVNLDAAASIAAGLMGTGARNRTAEQMAKAQDRDEAQEARRGEDSIERP